MIRRINPRIQGIILYTLPDVFSKAIGLILLPLILTHLTVGEFGQLELLFLIGTFLQFVFHFGWSSAHLRFYQEPDVDSDNLNITLLLFRLSIQALILLILWVIGLKQLTIFVVDDASLSVGLIGVIGLFVFREHLLFYENKFRLQEKQKHFSIVNISYGTLQLIFVYIFLVHFKLNLIGIIWGQLSATIVVLSTLLFIDNKWILRGKFSLSILKRCLRFGLPLIPSAIALLIITASDRYMLKWLTSATQDSLEIIGIYSFGLKIVALMTLITKGFQIFWAPYVYKTYKDKDAPRTFSYIFRVYTFLLSLLAFAILVLSPLIFIFFPNYEDTKLILPTLLCGCLLYSIGDYFCIGIDIKEKSSIRAKIGMLTAMLNIIANFFLIPLYGAMGAAFATLLSYILFSIFQLIASNRLFPVKYPYEIWYLTVIWVLLSTPFFFTEMIYLYSYIGTGLVVISILFKIRGGFNLHKSSPLDN